MDMADFIPGTNPVTSAGVYVDQAQAQNGTVWFSNSDFILKRIARSIMYTIASQAGDSDVPDRNIGSFISYLISPFALLCMGMAVVLNRTIVFAATRRPTTLPLLYRIMLRSIAIYSLVCQLGPLFTALKYASPTGLGSIVPAYFDLKPGQELPNPTLLWKLYRAICIGHFVETFSSVIQARVPYSETGLTLFEYSVAFQEVQSAQKLSTEILVVSILSAFSQLALHVQGLFNSYKYRLIPSATFGIMFLAYFASAVYQGRLLFFPSVCVIGYLPQLAISGTVIICGCIYALALVFAGGPANLQTSMKSFSLDMSEDFYTCLMKLGIVALTSATKATYLTESTALSAPLLTWIEQSQSQDWRPVEVANPYKNEVTVSFGDNQASLPGSQSPREVFGDARRGPTSIITINRVFSAAHLIRSVASVVIALIMRSLRRLLSPFWRRSSSDNDNDKRATTPDVFEAMKHIHSQILYSSLDNEYEGSYSRLLAGDLIPEIDDSLDYDPEESESEDDYEYQSDFESDDETSQQATATLSHAAQQRLSSRGPAPGSAGNASGSGRAEELYDLLLSSPEYLLSLLAPQSPEETEQAKILSTHLSQTRVTRSKYRDLTHDDTNAILQLILDRRVHPLADDTPPEIRETVCVVCHSAPRQIVLWPCRCFALCEDCRLGLAVKSFKGCVCCRRSVESFSRVFVP